MFNTTIVKQYFYAKTRENYMATKQYINLHFKNNSAMGLLETTEDEGVESTTSSSAVTTASINANTGIEDHNLRFEEHFEKLFLKEISR